MTELVATTEEVQLDTMAPSIHSQTAVPTSADGSSERPSRPPVMFDRARGKRVLVSWLSSLVGLASLAAIHYMAPHFAKDNAWPAILGAFGTVCTCYSTPALATSADIFSLNVRQPRNVVGGSVISAFIGVSVRMIYEAIVGPDPATRDYFRWIPLALAVSLAIVAMALTLTTHPPGGAIAFIAVNGGPLYYNLGYLYIVFPVLLGVLWLTAVAFLFNNTYIQWPVRPAHLQSLTTAQWLRHEAGEWRPRGKRGKSGS
ncbi:hypothetical protein RI367_005590 [Sorochytrium milnesiophthora]